MTDYTIIVPTASRQTAPPTDATIVVRAAGGDHTSTNAAVAAAAAGDIIELQAATPGGTFTDTVPVNTNGKSGTQANPIIVRGRAGDTIIMSGVNGAVDAACWVVINSSWLDVGENILIDSGEQGQPGPMARGVWPDNSPDCIYRFRYSRIRLHAILARDGDSPRTMQRGGGSYLIGGLDGYPGGDGGDGLELESRAHSSIITEYAGGPGGHGVAFTQSGDRLVYHLTRGENLWDQEDDLLHPGVTTDGNRIGGFSETSVDCTFQDSVWGPIGTPYDNNSSGNLRFLGHRLRARRFALFGNTSGGSLLGAVFGQVDAGDIGLKDIYVCHGVFTDSDGGGFVVTGGQIDANADATNYGNFNIYNCIFWDLANNGDGNSQSHPVVINYASTKPATDPDNELSIRNCIFPTGDVIKLLNQTGANTILDVAGLNALPNCSGNIAVSDPQFVNPGWDNGAPYTKRRILRDATYGIEAFKMAHITESYDDYRSLEGSADNGAAALTQVNGAVTNSSTVTVDDALWFYAGSVDGASTVPGDTVNIDGTEAIITGIAGNVLTLDRSISAANGSDVFLGSGANPNIGWWQGAGFYS